MSKPKCYILVNKASDLYTSIDRSHYEVQFIFEYVTPGTGFNAAKAVIEKILDNADPEFDRIVLNGPAWLIAIAGYIWLTMEGRTTYGMLAFESKLGRYIERNEEISE